MDNSTLANELKIDYVAHTATLNIPYVKVNINPKPGKEDKYQEAVNRFSNATNGKNLIKVIHENSIDYYLCFDFGPYIPRDIWNMIDPTYPLGLGVQQQLVGEIILMMVKKVLPSILKQTQKSVELLKRSYDNKEKI